MIRIGGANAPFGEVPKSTSEIFARRLLEMSALFRRRSIRIGQDAAACRLTLRRTHRRTPCAAA